MEGMWEKFSNLVCLQKNMNQKLFDHMSREHGLILTESEMADIKDIVLENRRDADQKNMKRTCEATAKVMLMEIELSQAIDALSEMVSVAEYHGWNNSGIDNAKMILKNNEKNT
jgi:hypothetical protein